MKISSRAYASPARERQARQTRRDILAAATDLFVTQGYAGTSVAEIAQRAGVSAQTVYNAVGTKRELLRAAYDVTLVGDDEPVALAERPEVRRMYATTDPVALLHSYAALSRRTLGRLGPLMLQIAAGAAAGEPDLVEHVRVTDDQRLTGVSMLIGRVVELGALHPGVGPERGRDRIWTLNSVQVWHLLTGVRGWSGQEYEDWIGDAMGAAVLSDHR